MSSGFGALAYSLWLGRRRGYVSDLKMCFQTSAKLSDRALNVSPIDLLPSQTASWAQPFFGLAGLVSTVALPSLPISELSNLFSLPTLPQLLALSPGCSSITDLSENGPLLLSALEPSLV